MLKFVIGLVCGLSASALAQNSQDLKLLLDSAYLMAGVGPSGKAAAIKVDGEGRVICAP